MLEIITMVMKDKEVTYKGLSTNTKPTQNITNNATFYELDTGKMFTYSMLNINPVTSNGWWEV